MNPLDFKTQQITNSIMAVVELAFSQGKQVSWRTVFTFLKYPPESWEDDDDVDDLIEVNSESDLVLLRAMLSSMFAVRH
jgi:hypothetical protein